MFLRGNILIFFLCLGAGVFCAKDTPEGEETSAAGKMNLDLYYAPGSAPCRSVLITAKLLGLELNLKPISLLKKEHLKPEFVELNPEHTIPTLVDNGFTVWESHVIIIHLVEKYGKTDSLYPKDQEKHIRVLQRLFFDANTLYKRFGDTYYPLMFDGIQYTEKQIEKMDEAFTILNKFLAKSEFTAGNELTVADLSLLASVTTIQVVGYNMSNYPNVVRWLEKTKAIIPDYEKVNGEGVEAFRQLYLSLTQKKNSDPPAPSDTM